MVGENRPADVKFTFAQRGGLEWESGILLWGFSTNQSWHGTLGPNSRSCDIEQFKAIRSIKSAW